MRLWRLWVGANNGIKRGAMMTDKYLHIIYLATTEELVEKCELRVEGNCRD